MLCDPVVQLDNQADVARLVAIARAADVPVTETAVTEPTTVAAQPAPNTEGSNPTSGGSIGTAAAFGGGLAAGVAGALVSTQALARIRRSRP